MKVSNVPFKGTAEQETELRRRIAEHKGEKGSLMPIMQAAQEIYGYLPYQVQKIISDETGIPMEKIYGVATFYAQFSMSPKGQYEVSVCLGTACCKHTYTQCCCHHHGKNFFHFHCFPPSGQCPFAYGCLYCITDGKYKPIDCMHITLYPIEIINGVSPTPITYLYCVLSCGLMLVLGLWIFRKNQDRFVLYL